MKKKIKPQFEYLKDGYEEDAIKRWSEELQRSPEEVLKNCAEAVGFAGAEESTAKLAEVRAQSMEQLETFCRALSQQTERIPKPSGIFLSDEERRPAYRVICRLLGETETYRRELGATVMEMMAVDSLLARCARARNEATRILADVGAATRWVSVDSAFFASHGMLRAQLTRENEDAMRVAERAAALRDRLQALHGRILPDFCTRAEASADMAHDGAACNPLALIRLCGELYETAQSIFRQIQRI